MGRIVAFIFVLTLTVVSCSKYRGKIDNLNNGVILVLGHGGMGYGSTYPMNTREAFLQCLISYDVGGTEIDVQLTKDNVLVAFHDSKMNMQTNFTGKINSYTWEELKEARYTCYPNLRFEIVRLEDLFQMPETEGKMFSFDIKLYPAIGNEDYMEDFQSSFVALLSAYNLQNRCIVESATGTFLNGIRAALPEVQLYYYPGTTFEAGLDAIVENNYDGITIEYDQLSKEKVKQAHDLGIKVVTWDTQSKRENKLAVSYQPDMIITDEVRFLTHYLE